MNWAIIYPLLFIALGILLVLLHFPYTEFLRRSATFLLIRFFIPIITIYNVTYASRGLFSIIVAMIFVMFVMLVIAFRYTNDPVYSLCFFYLNIAGLGLPIGLSFFGEQEAKVLIAAYIGSSIFGNAIGPRLLSGHKTVFSALRTLWSSPTFIAVLIGLALIPLRAPLQMPFFYLYDFSKIILNFLSLVLLGLWIAKTHVRKRDLLLGFKISCARLVVFSCLITLLILYGYWRDIPLIIDNKQAFYLIGCLPSTTNILIIESHVLKTGRAAPLIIGDTFISIVFLALYVLFFYALQHLMLLS